MSLSQDEADELELLELEELEAASMAKPEIGMGESAYKGAESSALFGFGDELSGRIAQGVDYAQGIFGDSPTEQAAKAKAEGVDIGDIPSTRDELYRQARDATRKEYAEAEQANPKSFGAGGIASSLLLPGLGAGAGVGKIAALGAAQGAAYGAGASEEEDMKGVALDALIGAGIGAGGGAAAKLGGDYAAKTAIPWAGKQIGKVGNSLRGTAEDLAVRATGATGKQASRFSDDAGRELLDRGLVRFGDSPGKIADRVAEESYKASQAIGDVLKELDSKGVTASVDNVANGLEKKIQELSKIDGNEDVIQQLTKQVRTLYERGDSNIPVSNSEASKRIFQKKTNYFSPEVDKKSTAIIGKAYREEGERAATAFNPELGAKFKDEKSLLGLLTPIQEAAEGRASTLNQSPPLGLNDLAAATATAASGAPIQAGAVVGRRLLAPRISSMMAVSTDAIANVARMAPDKLGKFAPVLQKAAERGSQAVAATNFMLQQSDPEYRAFLKKIQDEDDQNQ